MATIEIPLRSDLKNFNQRITLDGAEYSFDFEHNVRDDAWFMSISDSEGVSILEGKKLTTGAVLNRNVIVEDVLPGILGLIDTTGAGSNPGLGELGSTFFLLYEEAET